MAAVSVIVGQSGVFLGVVWRACVLCVLSCKQYPCTAALWCVCVYNCLFRSEDALTSSCIARAMQFMGQYASCACKGGREHPLANQVGGEQHSPGLTLAWPNKVPQAHPVCVNDVLSTVHPVLDHGILCALCACVQCLAGPPTRGCSGVGTFRHAAMIWHRHVITVVNACAYGGMRICVTWH